ncbi:MAG: gephyrin-like molybdotransferase Glp [Campylobacterota bacterium]
MKKLTYLEIENAMELALKSAVPTKKTEILPLKSAIGRFVASDIACQKNLPSFDNSAMDGYALKAEDANSRLEIAGTIYAGDTCRQTLQKGQCYKIMTGALMPNGSDSVVPFEDALDFDDKSVQVGSVKKGANFRAKGEELQEGECFLYRGDKVDAFGVALLASQGITHIKVYQKPSIAVVSTGNELKEPWENAEDKQIYNSNSFAIIAMLVELGYEATYAGVVPDDLQQSREYIKQLQDYDVVITTGGISMGEADFVAQAFEQNGLEVLFHGVNVKPGKPTMMGLMGKTYVMAMPGNPLTALVNTYLFASAILQKISGAKQIYHRTIQACNTESFSVKKKRANVVLGTLEGSQFCVTKQNRYGSGMLTPLLESNAMMITLGKDEVQEGENIVVIPFYYGFSSRLSDLVNRA